MRLSLSKTKVTRDSRLNNALSVAYGHCNHQANPETAAVPAYFDAFPEIHAHISSPQFQYRRIYDSSQEKNMSIRLKRQNV
jgi:hypothetical protein